MNQQLNPVFLALAIPIGFVLTICLIIAIITYSKQKNGNQSSSYGGLYSNSHSSSTSSTLHQHAILLSNKIEDRNEFKEKLKRNSSILAFKEEFGCKLNINPEITGTLQKTDEDKYNSQLNTQLKTVHEVIWAQHQHKMKKQNRKDQKPLYRNPIMSLSNQILRRVDNPSTSLYPSASLSTSVFSQSDCFNGCSSSKFYQNQILRIEEDLLFNNEDGSFMEDGVHAEYSWSNTFPRMVLFSGNVSPLPDDKNGNDYALHDTLDE